MAAASLQWAACTHPNLSRPAASLQSGPPAQRYLAHVRKLPIVHYPASTWVSWEWCWFSVDDVQAECCSNCCIICVTCSLKSQCWCSSATDQPGFHFYLLGCPKNSKLQALNHSGLCSWMPGSFPKCSQSKKCQCSRSMTFWCGSGSRSGSADRIRIRGSMPLTNGSGSVSRIRILLFLSFWPSRCQQKTNLTLFSCYFLKVHLHYFSKIKSQKESQNSRIQGFSYYFCMMMEGSWSGSGSIPLISVSGSGRPKNTWIRWIRNTEKCSFLFVP